MRYAISPICAVASSVERPTFARLCPSAADTTYSMEPNPAAIARLAPLGLATSAENSMPGKLCNSAASSAASANAGTFDGDTNAVASISRTPVAATAESMSSLADNGIGFEDRYASRIFQVFQRLHGRDEYDGTGVGLAVCKKIVDRHGGTITASGRPGDGATFTVFLPGERPA